MSAQHDSMFPIQDHVGAWVPHGRFLIDGAACGPLNGLRFAVKDLFDVAGHPTGAGNPAWLESHAHPVRSSPLVEQLLAAGATLVGKTLTAVAPLVSRRSTARSRAVSSASANGLTR